MVNNFTKRPKFIRPDTKLRKPSETQEAIALASHMKMKYPDILYTHIANEQQQSKVKEGLLPGVSDYMIFEIRGGYHGMALELKRRDGTNHLSDDQKKFFENMRARNYYCAVAYGWKEALKEIDKYLNLDN